MPFYDHLCDSCGVRNEEFHRISEDGLTSCPKCGAEAPVYHQVYEVAPYAIIRGAPTTIGQQAELNMRRLGEEQSKEILSRKPERGSYTGPLPEGAVVTTGDVKPATPPWRDGSFGNPKLDKPLDITKVRDVQKYIHTGEL